MNIYNENEFVEYASKRCEKALRENKEYLSQEQDTNSDTDELQEMAEIICYKRGFQDALHLIKCE
jgi:hypothetical protein